jgi:hypothetical protein
VDVLVGGIVAVSVSLAVGVGVAEAEVGVFITGISEAPQLVTITLMRTMLTNKRLILIPVTDLHLQLPNGLKQRTALLETCFTQVA